ncbi:hypothetical protein ASG67_15420 [Sphingomonas sp. Leaf339]|nr:hypothetical protein ASG67_15420 [Sphingomonas sp. Leaf339]
MASCHVGCRPGFIDEHQPLGIKVELTVEPVLARAQLAAQLVQRDVAAGPVQRQDRVPMRLDPA